MRSVLCSPVILSVCLFVCLSVCLSVCVQKCCQSNRPISLILCATLRYDLIYQSEELNWLTAGGDSFPSIRMPDHFSTFLDLHIAKTKSVQIFERHGTDD